MEEAEVFLVRVWRREARPRAAVQRVGTDTAAVFSEPLTLGRFLLDACVPAASAAATPPHTDVKEG